MVMRMLPTAKTERTIGANRQLACAHGAASIRSQYCRETLRSMRIKMEPMFRLGIVGRRLPSVAYQSTHDTSCATGYFNPHLSWLLQSDWRIDAASDRDRPRGGSQPQVDAHHEHTYAQQRKGCGPAGPQNHRNKPGQGEQNTTERNKH